LANKPIALLWFGMPCQSWSRAQRFDGGPPPLHDAVFLWGRPQLSDTDAAKVSNGNALLLWTTDLATWCSQQSLAHLGTHQITMPGFKPQIIGFQSFARRACQCMRDVVPH